MSRLSVSSVGGSTKVALLFPWGRFILFPVTLFGLIFFLYTDRSGFEEEFNDQHSDAISIAYLKQLVRSNPKNWKLVYRLSSQLQTTGQSVEAWRYLKGFDTNRLNGKQDQQRLSLMADVAASRAFAAGSKDRKYWQDQALKILQETDWSNAPPNILQALARLALSLGSTVKATDLYRQLAETDWENQYQWQLQAARWSQASVNADQAGDLYLRAASFSSSTDDKLHALTRSVEAYMSQGQYSLALTAAIFAVDISGPQSDNLLRVISLANQLGQSYLASRYLKRILPLDLSQKELEQVFRLSLQSGAITQSLQAAKRLLSLDSDNVIYRKQLATLYEWNNLPAKALDHWIWLSTHTRDVSATGKARKLANGLFDSQKLVDLLVFTAKRRPLEKDELDELVASWEDVGRPDRAEAFLQEYLEINNDDEVAWHMLVETLQNQQKLPALIEIWKTMHSRFLLNAVSLLEYAYALQDAGRLIEAVELLTSTTDTFDGTELESEFWQLLVELAWYVDNDEVVILALEQSMSLNPDNTRFIDRYLSLGSLLPVKQRLVVARSSFERFADIRYGLVVLETAALENEWSIFDKTLAQLRRKPGVETSCRFYYFLGLSYERNGAVSQADKAYLKSIQCTGSEDYLIANYLYFLINTGQRERLTSSLYRWQEQALGSPLFWQAYALGWSAVGNILNSLDWYRKAIEYQPDNVLTQLAYADVLAMGNFHAAAQRVRQRVVRQLRNRSSSVLGREWQPHLLTLNTQLNGLANSILLTAEQNDSIPELWLPSLVSLLIEEGQMHAAQEWVSQGKSGNVPIPLYQQLVIALQGDKEELQTLLPQLPEGPERVEALSMLGMDGEALGTALGQLGVTFNDTAHYQLLGQSTQLSVAAPSGWRVRVPLSSDSALTTGALDFTLAQRYDEWHFQLDTSWRSVTDQSTLMREKPESWNDYSAQTTVFDEDGYWRAQINFSEREKSLDVGLRLTRYHIYDARWASTLSVGVREIVDTSSLLNAFSQRNTINMGFEWRPTPRNLIYSSFSHQEIQDIYEGHVLGRGYLGQMFWQHQLTTNYPEWSITAGVDWQAFNLASELGTEFAAYLQEGSSPSSILNENYRRYFLNSRWQHGEPGELNARVPSPRWFFGVGVGYQQKPEGIFGYTLEMGVGWRMLGDDELTLMSFYSDNALPNEGGRGYHATISYQHRFGR